MNRKILQYAARLGRIESLRAYLELIKRIRLVFLAVIAVMIALVIFAAAVAGLYIGILNLPYDIAVRAGLVLAVSGALFLAAVLMVSRVTSQKKWMEVFNADAFVKQFMKQDRTEKGGYHGKETGPS